MAQKETIMGSPAKDKKNILTVVILLLAFIAMTGQAAYLYMQNIQLKKNPQSAAQEEVKSIVAKVGRLIVLPEGETPTIATVTDTKLLKDQPFFAKAQVGDKVLIYTTAKKAILYNPTSNKIVEVAPLNIGATQGTPAPNPSQGTTDTTPKK